MKLWVQDSVSDSDMKARIIAVQTKMQTFSFFYGLQLAIVALSYVQCMLKIMPSFLSMFFDVYDQTESKPPLDQVTQATVKLELQAPSLSRLWKMHQGILRVMLNLSTIPM